MAIYHLRVKVTGRQIANPKPGGAVRRSAIAAAAYRSGDRLFDNQQGKWFQRDAEENHEIEHKAILAPEGAPAWVFDRTALWNAVERGEMNKDGSIRETAQLFREVEITLPRELSVDERIALVEGFAREQFVSQGMVADIAIHNKAGSDGREQPHAHIMLTMRRLDPARGTGFAKAKAREWGMADDVFKALTDVKSTIGALDNERRRLGEDAPLSAALASAQRYAVDLRARADTPERDVALKRAEKRLSLIQQTCKTVGGDTPIGDALMQLAPQLQEAQASLPLLRWRSAWADATNAALDAHGSAARVDHRTLAAQRDEALAMGDFERARELDREPQKPLGVAGHLEDAYRYMKDRISGWVAIEQRGRMARYLRGMRHRDPLKAAQMIERLSEWTQEVIDRFNQRGDDRDLVPEVRLER